MATKTGQPTSRLRGITLQGAERREAFARLEEMQTRLTELEARIAEGQASEAERRTARALAWRIEAQRERIFDPQRKYAYESSISISK